MIKILYCNESSIINALAESLVIGGLPMNDKVIYSDDLKKEITKLNCLLNIVWCNKDNFIFDKENKCIRVKEDLNDKDLNRIYNIFFFGENKKIINTKEEINEYLKDNLDVYTKRGRTLGNVPKGSGHNSLFKGVEFNMIIKFPLYWLKELQRYHFTDIISSQSTMHKVLKFNLDDMFSEEVDPRCIEVIKDLKAQYEKEIDKDKKKKIWRRMINSLPDGLHMSQGITMNYLQLTTMIPQREHHKLSEWSEDLIPFFKELPYYDFFLI